MKFTLGRFVFRTKGDAVKAVRNVLNSALPGLFLSGDELDLVTAVLGVVAAARPEWDFYR
jgi:hypothetical protein